MHAAVADTSPLRYLVLIGAIEVLPRLFERVFIPEIVHAELCHANAPAWCAAGRKQCTHGCLSCPTPTVQDADLRLLDAGIVRQSRWRRRYARILSLLMNAPVSAPREPGGWKSRVPLVCWIVPRDAV